MPCGDGEAEPVHAGIHVDRGLELLRLRAAERRPFVDLLGEPSTGPQVDDPA